MADSEPEKTEEKPADSFSGATVSSQCSRLNKQSTEMLAEKPLYLRQREKVLYPRKTRILTKTAVIGGMPIDEETCKALRTIAFGSCASPPKPEWSRTGFTLRPYGQNLAFGLRAARNTTRGLTTAVQATMLKHFLFKSGRKDASASPESSLQPSYERQIDVLTSAIAEIIWRCADGFAVQSTSCALTEKDSCRRPTSTKAIVTLPQEISYFQHSLHYFQDGITETLHLFQFESLQDLEIFIKRYLYLFQDEGGPGAILLLYSALLSRGLSRVRADLENPKGTILSGCPEEGPLNIVILCLTGRVSPHLHNGVIHVGDENTYAVPQWGVLVRAEIGFLVHESAGELSREPGSRLKTPSLPIWVSLCQGHHAVLFNTNRELLRNYHAERRFHIHYYTCGGTYASLTVDTRTNSDGKSGHFQGTSKECLTLDIASTPLERLIRSKWQDADIQWNGPPIM